MDEYDVLLALHGLEIVLILLGIYILWRVIVSALENLNANIAKLKTDVEALVAAHSTNSEAQIQAAADAVAAVDNEVLAATPAPQQ